MSTLQKYIVAAAVAVAGFAFSAAAQPAEARHGWGGYSPYYSRHYVPRHHYWHRPHYPRYYRPHHFRHRPPVWHAHPGRYHYYPYHAPRRSWGFGFHFGW